MLREVPEKTSAEAKQKILEFLVNWKGSEKGVATAAEIQKGTGLKKQEAAQLLKKNWKPKGRLWAPEGLLGCETVIGDSWTRRGRNED